MAEPPEDSSVTVKFDMAGVVGTPARPAGNAVPTIPGYTIVQELARGGMGAVYHARQVRPEREVALKVMLPQLAEVPEMQARFQIEARAMAALDHPGILPVYEVGEADGIPFFSMKFVSGGTLGERLKAGPMTPCEASTLLSKIARAVHFAHQHGTLHRDLKPANFLFDDSGRVYVSDFGLAKLELDAADGGLTQAESLLGTPHYMPPEVAGGSTAGCTMAGDLYSLGAVLYECLCGRRPHGKFEAIGQLLRAIVDEPVQPPGKIRPGLPRDLEIICMKALEKSPSARYASVAEFADDLDRWLTGLPIAARPVGVAEKLWSWSRRHPLPASLAATLLITIAAGSVLLAISNRERGLALGEARQQLRRALIDQARAERLLRAPGHRELALRLLRQAADIGASAGIEDEVIALLAQSDILPVTGSVGPAPLPPPAWDGADPISSSLRSGDGKWILALHASGRASLGRTGASKPLRSWNPASGRAVLGNFSPDGRSIVLAETSAGTAVVSLNEEASDHVLQEPGPMVSFVQADTASHRIALGRADGLKVIDFTTGAQLWQAGPGPVRCAPAWSPDGAQLVVVLGETRGFSLFDAANGRLRSSQRTTGWPVQIVFHPNGRLLACATDEPAILLCEVPDGRIRARIPASAKSLRFSEDGSRLETTDAGDRPQAWLIENSIGFREWTSMPRPETDGTVFDFALSPDGRFLLSTATAGVRIWSVAGERQTGFHATENQRIDAPTSAWWLGDKAAEILVQIPGGLERVPIDPEGRPGAPRRVARPPGTTVIDVTDDGTWLVKSIDPEAPPCEAWPGGDPAGAHPVPLPARDRNTFTSRDGRRRAIRLARDEIKYSSTVDAAPWRLTPPERIGLHACVFSADGNRMFVLGSEHRIFSWDLAALRAELRRLNF